MLPYGNTTTIGEIFELRRKVLEEINIFTAGKRSAAKLFLARLLSANDSADEAQLREKYKAATSKSKIPETDEEFWEYIEIEYLGLEAEPSIKFSELALQVNEDLVELEKLLQYIRGELGNIEEKKSEIGRLTADERYYRNQLEYYEAKNLQAKDEIVDFMTNRIKKYAINKASKSRNVNFLSTLIVQAPYKFARRMAWVHSNPYDPRNLDDYSNKFLDLPLTKYRELVKKCKASPEKFKEYALTYISGELSQSKSVKEKLNDLIGKSHILANRKKVIQSMLAHFEEGDYISFVSMAPLQIEGIFADICREIGISENQLDMSSLNDKLSHIDKSINSFFFFEYYSFKFPILRNLVAHGGLVDGDLEETAIHLLLDLLPVCDLTVSEELPTIKALSVLEAASQGEPKYLIKWLDIRSSVSIPEFYKAQAKIAATEALYNSQRFWDHLTNDLKSVGIVEDVKNSAPVKTAGKLKSNGIAVEAAEKFLKSSKKVAQEAIESRTNTLEGLLASLDSLANQVGDAN